MFSQLLEESVVESTALVAAAAAPTAVDAPSTSSAPDEPIAARQLFTDPEEVQRLVVKMLGDKTYSWW
jgi:hypothetical protein